MKRVIYFWMAFVSGVGIATAQTPSDSSAWVFSAEGNLYLFQGQSILLPVFRADKNKLHFEARYNYEDLRTFSAWAGYNFRGGKKVEYAITPMLGGVTGNTKGIAAGLEFTFTSGRFELYDESEYLFDASSKDNNYFYSWMDLSYSITENVFVGLSAQRTRMYKTNLDIQRGLLFGGVIKNWEITGYLYNLGFDTPFGILTLGVEF